VSDSAAKTEETFLLRITGKGISIKRRIPGWLAARIALWLGETDA
jgi:hypothetical protein